MQIQLSPIIAPGGMDPCVWAGAGKKVVAINLKTMKVQSQLVGHQAKINCMAVTGEQVWSCGSDGTVFVWNTETHEVIDEVEYHHCEMLCMVPSRSRSCLYAGTRNKTVMVWNTKSLKVIREQVRHDGAVQALAQGAPHHIWSGSADCTACVWQESEDDVLSLNQTVSRGTPVLRS